MLNDERNRNTIGIKKTGKQNWLSFQIVGMYNEGVGFFKTVRGAVGLASPTVGRTKTTP